MAIQYYEAQPDGTELIVQRWFHTGADGMTRSIELIQEGTDERVGETYVRSCNFGWPLAGYRGTRMVFCRWVPDCELWYVTDSNN